MRYDRMAADHRADTQWSVREAAETVSVGNADRAYTSRKGIFQKPLESTAVDAETACEVTVHGTTPGLSGLQILDLTFDVARFVAR